MERVSLLKVGGASAILYSILLVVIVALFAATDLLDAQDASEVLPAMEEDKVIVPTAGWLIVLAALLLAIAGLALFQAPGHAGSLMRLALLAFVGVASSPCSATPSSWLWCTSWRPPTRTPRVMRGARSKPWATPGSCSVSSWAM